MAPAMANDNTRPMGLDLAEMVARLLGWACVLGAIGFLVMAAWFDGSWWPVVSSTGGAAISRALQYRFKHYKPRRRL